MVVEIDDWYNEILTLKGKDAEEFVKNDQKEVNAEEEKDLLDALKYYQENCRS